MVVQVDVLAPVARLDQFFVRIAVHPAVVFVMVAQGVMRRAPTHGGAHGDALQIQLVGDGAHTGLGAFVVDVPALKVLQGRGIHDDQGRVNDGAGIHQCP